MEISLSNAVKNRIREKMTEQKISENELATRSGITTSTLNSFMNNKCSSCTISTLGKICFGLDISISEFFRTKEFNMKLNGTNLTDEN